ncbi:MAG: hypothetical protein Kow0092_24870 [Deferrisomatales bacterium]
MVIGVAVGATLLAGTTTARWMGRGGMGGMCRMMDVTSTPVDPASLPEADSRGAEILQTKCTMCHGLVTPRQHAAPDWRPIVDRMDRRMNLMQGRGHMMGAGVTLTATERAELIDYLQRNAFQPAPADLPGAGTGPAERFRAVCGQCHAPPAPDQHRAAQWPAVVDRMAKNMQNMGYGDLSEGDRRSIETYLKENAKP